MPEIGTSGSMSGDGKRSVGHRPQATAPILDFTISEMAVARVGGRLLGRSCRHCGIRATRGNLCPGLPRGNYPSTAAEGPRLRWPHRRAPHEPRRAGLTTPTGDSLMVVRARPLGLECSHPKTSYRASYEFGEAFRPPWGAAASRLLPLLGGQATPPIRHRVSGE